jgi:hypothetical protein
MQPNKIISAALFFVFTFQIHAQTRFPGCFAVSFDHKNNTPYSVTKPLEFLSQKAVERRQRCNIAIDTTDLPVNPAYIDSLSIYARVKHRSRWQNSALALIDDTAKLVAIANLPFVTGVQYLGPPPKKKKIKQAASTDAGNRYEPVADSFPDYGATRNQLDLIGLTPLHHAGYNGKGIIIGILDAGFYNANKMKAFNALRDRQGIIATKDFVLPGNDVYREHSHGSLVLSTIAGIIPGEYYGAATGADFLLLRTEDVDSEYPVEEYYWLTGAEYADSAGADIITSSLSYTQFDDTTLNHTQAMLNGKTAIVSRAAATAFSKGIVVTTSAGNDGNKPWRKIGFPGDADGVITVGATDSLGNYATLSSQGYAADGRVKPDIVAVGKATALVSTSGKVFYGNGTSFSTPTIAGAMATLMQVNPGASALSIRKAVLQSAHNRLNPDSLTGFGLPDFFVASMIIRNIPPVETNDNISLKAVPNPFNSGFYIITSTADSQQVQMALFDISGKKLWQSKTLLPAGTTAFYIDALQQASNGLYFIKVINGEKVYTRKIIKQQ